MLYIPRLDAGGPDSVFYTLASGLQDRGFNIFLITNYPGGHYWNKLDARIGKISIFSHEAESAKCATLLLARQIKRLNPDVVLCTLGSIFTASLAKLFYGVKVPLVFRPANHLTRNARELMKASPIKHSFSWLFNILTLHLADHVVCQSEDLYEDFRSYKVPEGKLSVIYNPVVCPTSRLMVDEPAQNHVGKQRLLAVGRLMYQKGFDVLIEAIALLRDRFPRISLIILGDGPEGANLKKRLVDLNVGNHIQLMGFSRDIPQYLVAADFLVSSSRYEGFPNAVLEALSHGVPVIATNCPGGTRVMVKNGLTGWLCSPESPRSLADTIEKAFSSPRLSSTKIRQFINDNFESSKIVSAYADLLQRVVKARKDRTNKHINYVIL